MPNTIAVNSIIGNELRNVDSYISLLKSLTPIDEIVIVSSGYDGTFEKLMEYAATDPRVKIVTYTWIKDFADARNLALDQTDSSYVLWLDADDKMDSESIEQLQKLKDNDLNQNTIYMFKIANTGRPEVFDQIRMVPRTEKFRWVGAIHEQIDRLITLEDKIELNRYSHIVIEHTGYQDDTIREKKARRNLEILLKHPDVKSWEWNRNVAREYTVIGDQRSALNYYQIALSTCQDEQVCQYLSYLIGKLRSMFGEDYMAMAHYYDSGMPEAMARFAHIYQDLDVSEFLVRDYITRAEYDEIREHGKKIAKILIGGFLRYYDSRDPLAESNTNGSDIDHVAQYFKSKPIN